MCLGVTAGELRLSLQRPPGEFAAPDRCLDGDTSKAAGEELTGFSTVVPTAVGRCARPVQKYRAAEAQAIPARCAASCRRLRPAGDTLNVPPAAIDAEAWRLRLGKRRVVIFRKSYFSNKLSTESISLLETKLGPVQLPMLRAKSCMNIPATASNSVQATRATIFQAV